MTIIVNPNSGPLDKSLSSYSTDLANYRSGVTALHNAGIFFFLRFVFILFPLSVAYSRCSSGIKNVTGYIPSVFGQASFQTVTVRFFIISIPFLALSPSLCLSAGTDQPIYHRLPRRVKRASGNLRGPSGGGRCPFLLLQGYY